MGLRGPPVYRDEVSYSKWTAIGIEKRLRSFGAIGRTQLPNSNSTGTRRTSNTATLIDPALTSVLRTVIEPGSLHREGIPGDDRVGGGVLAIIGSVVLQANHPHLPDSLGGELRHQNLACPRRLGIPGVRRASKEDVGGLSPL